MIGTKRFINLLRYPLAAKPWVRLFHFDDGLRSTGAKEFGNRG
jgi:hypothetical protein